MLSHYIHIEMESLYHKENQNKKQKQNQIQHCYKQYFKSPEYLSHVQNISREYCNSKMPLILTHNNDPMSLVSVEDDGNGIIQSYVPDENIHLYSDPFNVSEKINESNIYSHLTTFLNNTNKTLLYDTKNYIPCDGIIESIIQGSEITSFIKCFILAIEKTNLMVGSRVSRFKLFEIAMQALFCCKYNKTCIEDNVLSIWKKISNIVEYPNESNEPNTYEDLLKESEYSDDLKSIAEQTGFHDIVTIYCSFIKNEYDVINTILEIAFFK